MSRDEQESGQPGTARQAAPGAGGPSSGAAPRMIASAELFAGHSELTIVHAQEYYRLRITRNDKLILTK